MKIIMSVTIDFSCNRLASSCRPSAAGAFDVITFWEQQKRLVAGPIKGGTGPRFPSTLSASPARDKGCYGLRWRRACGQYHVGPSGRLPRLPRAHGLRTASRIWRRFVAFREFSLGARPPFSSRPAAVTAKESQPSGQEG